MAALDAGGDEHGREYYKDEVGRLKKWIEKERCYKYEREFAVQHGVFITFLSSHTVKKRSGDQQKLYKIRDDERGRPR